MKNETWVAGWLIGISLAAMLISIGCDRMPPHVRIRGQVVDIADNAPIEGAQVQATDINNAPVGDMAITDAQGKYELTVPQFSALNNEQDEDKEPEYAVYMLHCQALGYQPFPDVYRPSLPLDMALAEKAAPGPETLLAKMVIDETITTLTTIKLIGLEGEPSALGILSGRVALPRRTEEDVRVLIVAENEATGEAYTTFSGLNGEYTIFNLPAGTYRVHAYTQGIQFDPATGVVLEEGMERAGVELAHSSKPLNTVNGNIQIVNAPGGSRTSVILAVESTFNEATGRGVAPPGLRVANISGSFTMENVPDGRYAVLAAFENDGLVRDPDEFISGTDTIYIEVPAHDGAHEITIPSFKVTGALAVIRPGAETPEAVHSPTPTFEWADDASEDGYEIWVFDSFGYEIWHTEIPGVSGSATVLLDYAGPSLDEGMYYQFRVASFREVQGIRSYISITEELRGVFYYQAVN